MADRTARDIDNLQIRLQSDADQLHLDRATHQGNAADASLQSAREYAKQIIDSQMNDRTAPGK